MQQQERFGHLHSDTNSFTRKTVGVEQGEEKMGAANFEMETGEGCSARKPGCGISQTKGRHGMRLGTPQHTTQRGWNAKEPSNCVTKFRAMLSIDLKVYWKHPEDQLGHESLCPNVFLLKCYPYSVVSGDAAPLQQPRSNDGKTRYGECYGLC